MANTFAIPPDVSVLLNELESLRRNPNVSRDLKRLIRSINPAQIMGDFMNLQEIAKQGGDYKPLLQKAQRKVNKLFQLVNNGGLVDELSKLAVPDRMGIKGNPTQKLKKFQQSIEATYRGLEQATELPAKKFGPQTETASQRRAKANQERVNAENAWRTRGTGYDAAWEEEFQRRADAEVRRRTVQATQSAEREKAASTIMPPEDNFATKARRNKWDNYYGKRSEEPKARERYTSETGGATERAWDEAFKINEKLSKKLNAVATGHAERLTALDQLVPPGTENRQKLEYDLRQRGLKTSNLKRITSDTSGTTRFDFGNMQDGVVNRYTTSLDKLGNLLPNVSRRQQDFFTAVKKDAGEFLKWSLGISLVLLPLQKMQEMVTTAIANQSKLADITIAMSDSNVKAAETFDTVAETATRTGTGVNDALDAFTLAYRAAGGAGDATERFATANALLNDSLILSRLSGMEEAVSIDTLAAALKQSNMDLTEGTTLLDLWVRTTKVANVDLNTLATSFAIVGDTALAAGIGVEQLNGIIAVIAETGVASGKEAANTVKAIISGVQSDKAVSTLEKYGFYLKDAEGNAKDFLSLMREIYNLRQNNTINDTQFSEITRAIGGGVRRQAAVSSFISNLDRVDEIAGMQLGASGEAATAMAIKLDTVQTSLSKLSNVFSSLAQSMGSEGGILSAFKILIDLLTGGISILDKFIAAAGKAGSLALLGGAAVGILGQGKIAAGVGTLADNFIPPTSRLGMSLAGSTIDGRSQSFGKRIIGSAGGQGRWSKFGAGMSGIIAGANIIGNLTDENLKGGEKWGKIGVDAAAGMIGILTGNPLWALAGAAVGEAAVTAIAYKATGSDLFKGFSPTWGTSTPEETTDETLRKTAEARQNELDQEIQNKLFDPGALGAIEKIIASVGSMLTGDTLAQTRVSNLSTFAEPAKDIQQYLAEAYLKQQDISKLLSGGTPTFDTQVESTAGPYADQIKIIQETIRKKLIEDLVSGNIKATQYGNYTEGINAFNVTGARAFTAFGDKMGTPPDKSFEKLAKIYTYAPQEELTQLNKYMDAIAKSTEIANNALNLFNADQVATAQQKLNDTYAVAIPFIDELFNSLQDGINLLDIQDLSDYLQLDFKKILSQAYTLQEQDLLAQPEIEGSKEKAKEYTTTFDDFLVKLGTMQYETVKGLDPKYMQQVLQTMEEAGEALKKQASVGFDSFDMTQGKFASYLPGYESLLGLLTSKGYTPDFSELVPIFTDSIGDATKKDWKVVQYYLQQILETEQKALQTNVYNLPEGMSVFLPWQALMERGTGQGGGVGNLDKLIPATDGAKDALINLKDATLWFEDALYQFVAPQEGSSGVDPRFSPYIGRGFRRNNDDMESPLPTTLPDTYFGQVERRTGTSTENARSAELFKKLYGTLHEKLQPNFRNGLDVSRGDDWKEMAYWKSNNMSSTKASGASTAIKLPPISTRINLDATINTRVIIGTQQLAYAISRAMGTSLSRFNNTASGSVRMNMV